MLYVGEDELDSFHVEGYNIVAGYVGEEHVWGVPTITLFSLLVNSTGRVVFNLSRKAGSPYREIRCVVWNKQTNSISHTVTLNTNGSNDILLTGLTDVELRIRGSQEALNDIEILECISNYGIYNVFGPTFSKLATLRIENQSSINPFSISLEGLITLETLVLNNCGITELEVDTNIELKNLTVRNNQLTVLLLDNNVNLVELDFGYNSLTDIDITNLVLLVTIRGDYNQLNSILLDNNPLLVEVVLNYNNLTEIDLEVLVNLQTLSLGNNLLTEIDLDYNMEIKYLYLGNIDIGNQNTIGDLDLDLLIDLVELDVGNLPISILNLEFNEEVVVLRVNGTLLEAIAIEHLDLVSLDIRNGIWDSTFDISIFPNLFEFRAEGNSFLTNLAVDDYLLYLDSTGMEGPNPSPSFSYSGNNFTGPQPTATSREAYDSLLAKSWIILGRPPLFA